MKRIWLLLLLAPLVMGAQFKWAIPVADSAAVLAGMRQAVPRIGFGHQGPQGVVDSDTVTIGAYNLFTGAERAALEAVFDSLGVAYGDSIAGFVHLPEGEEW